MSIKKSWLTKEITDYLENNRDVFSKLYKGEKYLIKKYISKNASVLDIGCAQGNLFSILKKKYKRVDYTGLDFNKKMINSAKKKFPKEKFLFYTKTDYDKFFKKKFDVVIIFGILHLNHNWQKILINASKVTKKYILFDLRLKLSKKQKTKNMINLNLNMKKKLFPIPYYLIEKKLLNNFFRKNFNDYSLDVFSYKGNASIYSSIKSKILFSNYSLSKND